MSSLLLSLAFTLFYDDEQNNAQLDQTG